MSFLFVVVCRHRPPPQLSLSHSCSELACVVYSGIGHQCNPQPAVWYRYQSAWQQYYVKMENIDFTWISIGRWTSGDSHASSHVLCVTPQQGNPVWPRERGQSWRCSEVVLCWVAYIFDLRMHILSRSLSSSCFEIPQDRTEKGQRGSFLQLVNLVLHDLTGNFPHSTTLSSLLKQTHMWLCLAIFLPAG